ncbi:hypothetical protein EON65_20800 [archaeon]|nr:MAG: hypothetical protein EON65_20800 [archaeon]
MEKCFAIRDDKLIIKPRQVPSSASAPKRVPQVRAPPAFRGQDAERDLNDRLERRIMLKDQMR